MITETPPSPKQHPACNKDKAEEPWRTVPVQNQSNDDNLSAPPHPTGAFLTVAGSPAGRRWCWWSCRRWQQQKDLQETSSLAQGWGCPWPQQPERYYRILQSPEINKPARLPDTASTQITCPRQLSWQPGQKKRCCLCSKALGRAEELHVPVPSLLKGPPVICLCEPGVEHPSSSSPWVLKGQWSSWASWCREDMEYNTHFLGYPGQKDSNVLKDFWR